MFPILILAALAVAVLGTRKSAPGSGSGTSAPPSGPVEPPGTSTMPPVAPPVVPPVVPPAGAACELDSGIPEPFRSQVEGLLAQASLPIDPASSAPLASALELAAIQAEMSGFPKARACLANAAARVKQGKPGGGFALSPGRIIPPITVPPQYLNVEAKS